MIDPVLRGRLPITMAPLILEAKRLFEATMALNGVIDFVDSLSIRGWAFDAGAPEEHLSIEIVAGNAVVGSGRADILRQDLMMAGIGLGDHAFDIRFSRALSHRELRSAVIHATSSNGLALQLRLADETMTHSTESVTIGTKSVAAPVQLTTFPLPNSDETHRPVFVLGAARSGTSAVAQALLKCGEFQGFEEGHFLWMLQRFLVTVKTFYESNGEDALPNRFTMLSHVSYTYMTGAARAVFIAAAREMFPSGRWVEKTPRPEMTEAARLMLEVWPNARFVFVKRRGIENIVSRLRKFPQLTFEDHCNDWRRSMEAWLRIRDLLGKSALEVEQLAIAEQPKAAAEVICEFLQLDPAATEAFAKSLTFDRPERTSLSVDLVSDIRDVGWSVAQITEFREICGPMMAAFNYGYSAEYFSAGTQSVRHHRSP